MKIVGVTGFSVCGRLSGRGKLFLGLWALKWAWQTFFVVGVKVGVANFFFCGR